MSGRERGEKLVEQLYAEREAKESPRRPHSLRPSEIGDECARKLWLRFRWADELEEFKGRMLRLFLRGQREEEVFVDELRSVYAKVYDRDPQNPGKQISFSALNGHINGYIDAIAGNVMHAKEDWVVVEFKTAGSKAFKQLEKDGVQVAQPKHYAQLQLYMHHKGLKEGLYMSVNKDTDQIHAEFVAYDPAFGEALMEKADNVIYGALAPPRINNSPSFYKCKMCSAASVCHGSAEPGKSCRTCEHSRPATADDLQIIGNLEAPNMWICEYHGKPLTTDDQYRGCGDFEFSKYLMDELAT